jgi:hypothetical protein
MSTDQRPFAVSKLTDPLLYAFQETETNLLQAQPLSLALATVLQCVAAGVTIWRSIHTHMSLVPSAFAQAEVDVKLERPDIYLLAWKTAHVATSTNHRLMLEFEWHWHKATLC